MKERAMTNTADLEFNYLACCALFRSYSMIFMSPIGVLFCLLSARAMIALLSENRAFYVNHCTQRLLYEYRALPVVL